MSDLIRLLYYYFRKMQYKFYQLQDYIKRKWLKDKKVTRDEAFDMMCFLEGFNNHYAPDEEFTTFYMKDKFGNDLDEGSRLFHSIDCIVYKQIATKKWLVKDRCLRRGILTYEQSDCIGIYPHIETITEEEAMEIMSKTEKKKSSRDKELLKKDISNLIDKYL